MVLNAITLSFKSLVTTGKRNMQERPCGERYV